MPGEQAGGGAVIVTVGSAGIGRRLAEALRARGADAVEVETSVDDHRTDLAALFALATTGRPLAAVVHAHLDRDALTTGDLAAMDDAAWQRRGEAELRHAVRVFQAAHDAFGAAPLDGPRRIVAIVGDIAILGAGGLVPLATAMEGIRSLVKNAARGWGLDGLTANAVSVPLGALGPDAPPGPVVATPSLPPGDAAADAAEAVLALLGPLGAAVNGQTLITDRGTVMV